MSSSGCTQMSQALSMMRPNDIWHALRLVRGLIHLPKTLECRRSQLQFCRLQTLDLETISALEVLKEASKHDLVVV